MHVLFANGAPNAVRIYNTPTSHLSLERLVGVFVQDGWSMNNGLTLNLGARYDTNTGWMPAQSSPAGTFVEARCARRWSSNGGERARS
jgi:outer membrane receptor protein involved in Fe transport